MRCAFLKGLGILALALVCMESMATETNGPARGWPPAEPAAIAHWRSLRFGMFIHWGPVSLTGREIGWSRGESTPIPVYDNLDKEFNPTNFNADEWVSIAKDAGMKYIVLTCKHHDGFCLWNTKLADHNIMHTPFHRDVVKELAAACRKQGIEFGAYYSVADWYNTNWPTTSPAGKVRREHPDMDAYEAYLQGQISELITNYGPLLTLWNDVPNYQGANFGRRGADTIRLARRLQPDILINNRTGDGGDYDTPEQRIGQFQLDRPWESCMTISAHNHWAWGGADDGVKSPAACLDMLVRCAGGDGNLLLNVGPRPDGRIDPAQANLLGDIGAWLKVNGESIYGTRGGPWKPTRSFASTRKGNTIYVHMLNWPDGPVKLQPIPAKIIGARILDRNDPVEVRQTEEEIPISVLPSSRRVDDTVVALDLDSDAMEISALDAAPAAATIPAHSPASAPLPGYQLVWSDEFDGSSLDTNKWDFRTDSRMWSKQKPENVGVRDGHLILAVRKEEANGMHYTGAGVISKREFRYGYYEARFKVPPGAGWHTSFWMMKHNGQGGTGANVSAQELDVCENDSVHLNSYAVNVHKWSPKPHAAMGTKTVQTPNLSADFHVFGCEFTPETVKYYFDGQLVQTVGVSHFAHTDQNIWLTTIASNLGGTKAVDDSKLPAAAKFDYVRFYEIQQSGL